MPNPPPEISKTFSLTDRVGHWIGAWQPLTGKGLAAFADAALFRTGLLHLVFVLVTTALVGWILYWTWFPAIQRSVEQLPETGAEIRHGRFYWPTNESAILGETPQFGIAVDPNGTSFEGQSADLQLELRPQVARLRGLAGYTELPYGEDWEVRLDRISGQAGWLAWNWVFITLAMVAAFLLLWLGGWLVALVGSPVVWLVAYLLGRDLPWGGALRLVLASWIPAALLLDVGLWGYSWNWVRIVGLTAATGGHLIVWVVWMLWAAIARPQRQASEPENPFRPPPAGRAT